MKVILIWIFPIFSMEIAGRILHWGFQTITSSIIYVSNDGRWNGCSPEDTNNLFSWIRMMTWIEFALIASIRYEFVTYFEDVFRKKSNKSIKSFDQSWFLTLAMQQQLRCKTIPINFLVCEVNRTFVSNSIILHHVITFFSLNQNHFFARKLTNQKLNKDFKRSEHSIQT